MSCFSLAQAKNSCHRSTFTRAGLRSAITDLKDGATTMHCWVPQSPNPSKPNLLLIHGLGLNAMWQFADLLRHVTPHYNVYVPDLVFFGDSCTTQPDRSDSFQAECVMQAMEAHSVRRLSLVGLSYGGFVAYSLAAKYKEAVERVVICCAAVCLEEKDLREGAFRISDLDEAAGILTPQTPQKLRELVRYTFFRPPPVWLLPSCLLMDFIQAMFTEFVQEKKDLIRAVPQNRKLSELPKIPQPTFIIWGEHDQVFPVEFAHKLKKGFIVNLMASTFPPLAGRLIGSGVCTSEKNAQLVVIKDAGHALNAEKPKEYHKHIKSFLVDSLPRSLR